LRALSAGFRPAIVEPEAGARPFPDFVYLQLAGPPLSISGRVVDEDDTPVAGARVWIADPTLFGLVGESPSQIEHLLATSDHAGPYNFVTIDADEPAFEGLSTVGPPNVCKWAVSDDDGRFELDGLLERKYRVHVMDPATLVLGESESFDAGERGVEVVLPRKAVMASLSGRVVSTTGRPVAGVVVGIGRLTFETPLRRGAATLVNGRWESAGRAVSDEDGRFLLRDVPRDGVPVQLGARADSILPFSRELLPSDFEGELVVTVEMRVHLMVELADPLSADAFRVLDADLEELGITSLRADSHDVYDRARILAGRSEVFIVPERTRYLELFLAGRPLERLSVQVVPGEVNRVRW
jgi:protocatechuate 3,4-dioxygenase beta subunit